MAMDAVDRAAFATPLNTCALQESVNAFPTALARSVVTMDAVDCADRATQARPVFLVRVNAFQIALANSVAMMDVVVCAAAQARALSA
jgi:hypothetical protein